MKTTENEDKLLVAILNSEYHITSDLTQRHGSANAAIWVDCVWGFEGKSKFGGTMASLAKKGLAATDGECCWLTEDGCKLAQHIAANKTEVSQ